MKQLKLTLSIAYILFSKAINITLIFIQAILSFILHTITDLLGWTELGNKKTDSNTNYKSNSKQYHSKGGIYTKKRASIKEESKAKGNAFEVFIAKSFPKEFYTLKEWRSDKYVDGLYADSNMYPDLEIEYKNGSVTARFAIECKFRSNLINDAIELAKPRQLENYFKYASERCIPVFIAVGLGGNPSIPDEVFIIPLGEVRNNLIRYQELCQYRVNHENYLFYDYNLKEVR